MQLARCLLLSLCFYLNACFLESRVYRLNSGLLTESKSPVESTPASVPKIGLFTPTQSVFTDDKIAISFQASDFTEYCVRVGVSSPDGCMWVSGTSLPTEVTIPFDHHVNGGINLYAWVRNAKGEVSNGMTAPVQFSTKFPLGQRNELLSYFGIFYMAMDTDGNFYVTNSEKGILIFDSNFNFVRQFGAPGGGTGSVQGANGIAVDSHKNVYILEGNRVVKFSNSGNYLGVISTSGTGDGQLSNTLAIRIDSSDNFFISDLYGDRVQKFNSSFQFQFKFGTSGTGDGQLDGVTNISLDSSGNIYVVERGNRRVQKFDPAGNYILKFGNAGTGNGQFADPEGIAVRGSNIYVFDQGNSRVQKFDLNGNYIDQFGSLGAGNSQFGGNGGSVEVSSTGDIFVVDHANSNIKKFNSSYVFQNRLLGANLNGNGQFYNPVGVAIDNLDNIYVLDSTTSLIQKFDSSGNFITQFGAIGTSNGQLSNPVSIDVDSAGNIYVADRGNNRLQKFSPTGAYVWKVTGLTLISSVHVDNADNVFVTFDSATTQVRKYTSGGAVALQFGAMGFSDGQFFSAVSVGTDAAGNIYVADRARQLLQKFTSAGVFISKKSEPGVFTDPLSIAVNAAGEIFYTDRVGCRFEMFSSTFVNTFSFGVYGVTGLSRTLLFPQQVALDSQGNIYIADSSNLRVVKLNPAGVMQFK